VNTPPLPQPAGDAASHLASDALERGLAALAPPRDAGTLVLIVSRREDGRRETPEHAPISAATGVPGDAWLRKVPQKIDAQVSVMNIGVARLIANGQPLTLFGDNLLVDLDLSVDNLPPGTRLRIGSARLEVTPEPHNGCARFRQRFGDAALRLTADPRFRALRLRGIYAKVVEDGDLACGDAIEVTSRG